MQKTLGGDRLGSGKKMKVELHGYERSTHNLGYLWRSTMAAGTLVPFINEIALPGDTFDIALDCDIKTHPTIGPLFGSYKVQLDIFQAPIRLYQGQLHNNKLGIGMNMAQVKLPTITLTATTVPADITNRDLDNEQVNPSCILSYLGIRGIGNTANTLVRQTRKFNGIPLLAYWDIYKNYYANKQEEIGIVVHTEREALIETIDEINGLTGAGSTLIPASPTMGSVAFASIGDFISIDFTGATPRPDQIMFNTDRGRKSASELFSPGFVIGTTLSCYYNPALGAIVIYNWDYITDEDQIVNQINLSEFPLENIDKMREGILAAATSNAAFDINTYATTESLAPYTTLLELMDGNEFTSYVSTQEGLGVKTYQSDLFNNWLSTEWIDGAGGISDVTAIDTSGGSFTIDTLNLSKKVYNMLNRIAVSGGTYKDWLDSVYTHTSFWQVESPIYHGGLIKELVFQEVVSNSESSSTQGVQPLGTLAGKGTMAKKHKGGQVRIKVDEPSYIMGIISLTPRIDYSQGNKWDTGLLTMDDLHKPALDEIGFQELITEQMAWWTTVWDSTNNVWEQKSAGKQPAWINYMTNVNQTRGNFAIESNEMFMTLNRRYEPDTAGKQIEDLTTYIDPAKFNFIFAETALDSQNFWAQIAVDMTVRRKMSAKIMPNL